MDFSADLEALYAGLPGGLVIPCLLPVTTMAFASELLFWKCGTKVLMPLMTPKKFTSKILWK